MDHSAPIGRPDSRGQYVPCLGHKPEWENVGGKRLEPNPSFFGLKKAHWHPAVRCCGAQMRLYKEVQTRRCKTCELTEDHVEKDNLALCLHCGRYTPCITEEIAF